MNVKIFALTVALLAITNIGEASEGFQSPWLQSMSKNMPKSCKQEIWKRVHYYEARPKLLNPVMRRMARWKGSTENACERRGISPWMEFGLILAESKANPEEVDNFFEAEGSEKAHVGMCQFDANRLPSWQRDDPVRIRLAKQWAETGDLKYLREWIPRDMRFNGLWNINQGAKEIAGHIERTGDSSYFPIGHNGGGGCAVIGIILHARENGVRISKRQVPYYVKQHNISFWKVYEAKGAAYNYWMSRGENLGMRPFADAAYSELFARWCVRNGVPIEKSVASKHKAVSAGVAANKNIAKAAYSAKIKSQKKKCKAELAEEKSQMETSAVIGFLSAHVWAPILQPQLVAFSANFAAAKPFLANMGMILVGYVLFVARKRLRGHNIFRRIHCAIAGEEFKPRLRKVKGGRETDQNQERKTA